MAAETPWWKTAKTARQGFVMGTLWAVLGLGQLLSVVVGGAGGWHLVLSAGMLALAGVYLVTAVALHLRERSSR